jgi:hypothetical protein
VAGADEGQATDKGRSKSDASKGGGKNRPRNQKKKKSISKDDRNTCHNYGKKEHANLTREDDEESLLMARVSEINIDPTPLLPKGFLHLHEPTTHVFLGDVGCNDGNEPHEGWYLDMGASNHMTEHANSFSLLDRTV